ncbi:hypothetical protein K443DRAFT_106769, partial [Laccaria amethystina LaAM-08-1]
GPVFCSLGLVWLWSFSSYKTGLPNTRLLSQVWILCDSWHSVQKSWICLGGRLYCLTAV